MVSLNGQYVDKVRKLTGEAIGRFEMIRENDRILVGLSGGKDSFILMHLLSYFQNTAPVKFEIIAGTFDPGYPEFNADAVAEYCKKSNWEHKVVQLPMEEILAETAWGGFLAFFCKDLLHG